MKNLILASLLFFVAIHAKATTVTTSSYPAKVVVIDLQEGDAAEKAQPKTVTIKLKQTITRTDCNKTTFSGKFFKAEKNQTLTFADFYLASTEVYCPLKEPVVETIYSEPMTLTVLPYVAGGNKVVIPADADLVVQ